VNDLAKLSLVMIVKNEEKYVRRCLDSVKDIVNEMVVVDTGSSDKTKEIAMSLGAYVYDFKWIDDFSAARNFALEKSTGEWNLVLDADEYVTANGKNDILNFIKNNMAIGRIKILSKFTQNSQIRHSQAFVSRLLPKGLYFEGRVHEQIVSNLPRINTNVEIVHDGYFETNKFERNIRLLLKEIEAKPNDQYVLYQIAKHYKLSNQFDLADEYFSKCYKLIEANDGFRGSVVVEYIYNIIAYKNFEQGLEIINEESQNLADYPDFHFVCGVFYMEMIFSNVEKFSYMLLWIEREYLTCLKLGDTDKYDSVVGTGSYLAAYNLGGYYEAIGDMPNAKKYYEISVKYNYQPAISRLGII
jgi:glycosyltransferase involved in cell wall biosynthesis